MTWVLIRYDWVNLATLAAVGALPVVIAASLLLA